MPTNLPPDYFEAEKQFRQASTTREKIAWLEEMLSIMPKHKGTDHLRADLRRRLARLRAESTTRKSSAGGRASAFHIDKEGAGQVAVVGVTNVGKSSLVAALTNAEPEISPSPYTTWTPTPGMMPFEDIQIQLIDTPPLSREFVEPEMMNLIRQIDLGLLVVDLQAYPIDELEEAVSILEGYRIVPYQWADRYEGQLRIHPLRLLVVVNKNDDESTDADMEVLRELLTENDWILLPVSAATGRHFDQLKQAVFDALNIIRVYSKPPGRSPDLGVPFVLPAGSTVEELAGKVHKDFLDRLKSARVWGSTAFDGQMVSRDYVLSDGDIVELRI